MSNSFPRGAEWRRWDLHVHTPASFQWNGGKRFAQMDAAEEAAFVESAIGALTNSECCAFGIMDYWTFDGFKKLRKAIQDGMPLRDTTLFPGVELRVEPRTRKPEKAYSRPT
jgi:hypothetical protein